MKNPIPRVFGSPPKSGAAVAEPQATWPDILNDWLEIKCLLNSQERSPLLGELVKTGCQADAIEIHPAFSVAGHLVVVAHNPTAKNFWLYDPANRKIGKQKLEI